MPSSEVYVGNLDPDTRSQELRDIFDRYGSINRCEVKFGGSAAFGFVGFDSSDDAESHSMMCHPNSSFADYLLTRAQRKEHGRSLRGRRLIVEFTKTTPGQNGRRGRYIGGDDRTGNGHGRDHSRDRDHEDSRGGYRRRRSPSYNRRSSKDRSNSDDRHRSRSPHQNKSNTKRHRSSSNQDQRSTSTSHTNKNGNSKKR